MLSGPEEARQHQSSQRVCTLFPQSEERQVEARGVGAVDGVLFIRGRGGLYSLAVPGHCCPSSRPGWREGSADSVGDRLGRCKLVTPNLDAWMDRGKRFISSWPQAWCCWSENVGDGDWPYAKQQRHFPISHLTFLILIGACLF